MRIILNPAPRSHSPYLQPDNDVGIHPSAAAPLNGVLRLGFSHDLGSAVEPAAARDCVIFDLDGTFAFLGDRSPYNASRCEEDEINAAVHFVYEAIRRGQPETAVILISGREERWRLQTERWLARHGIAWTPSTCGAAATAVRTPSSSARLRGAHRGALHRAGGLRGSGPGRAPVARDLGLPCFQVAWAFLSQPVQLVLRRLERRHRRAHPPRARHWFDSRADPGEEGGVLPVDRPVFARAHRPETAPAYRCDRAARCRRQTSVVLVADHDVVEQRRSGAIGHGDADHPLPRRTQQERQDSSGCLSVSSGGAAWMATSAASSSSSHSAASTA